MIPIGLTLPLSRGPTGYFDQSYDTLTQVKSNIINLLRTNPGERRMQPQFSSGLQELLFSPNIDESVDIIKKSISDKVSTWIPGVTVENVDLIFNNTEKNNLRDTYIVYVKIQFTVNKQSADLSMTFTSPSI